MKPKIIALLNTPPVRWNQVVSNPKSTLDYQQVVRELGSVACTASMLASYIETVRGTDGCGRKEHEDGVKEANRTLKLVRNALGFTNSAAGIFNF